MGAARFKCQMPVDLLFAPSKLLKEDEIIAEIAHVDQKPYSSPATFAIAEISSSHWKWSDISWNLAVQRIWVRTVAPAMIGWWCPFNDTMYSRVIASFRSNSNKISTLNVFKKLWTSVFMSHRWTILNLVYAESCGRVGWGAFAWSFGSHWSILAANQQSAKRVQTLTQQQIEEKVPRTKLWGRNHILCQVERSAVSGLLRGRWIWL